ncbi:hypothetical protein LLH00_16160 [bacterium]|nr:hypothetical protein [bacterium]
MKLQSPITFILGLALTAFGLVLFVSSRAWFELTPFCIGLSLMYLGWQGGRVATLVFGHVTVVIGFILITWGLYLLPYCKPIPEHIFGRPLFWGMFATGGGVCAIYHGFCRCIRKTPEDRRSCPQTRD